MGATRSVAHHRRRCWSINARGTETRTGTAILPTREKRHHRAGTRSRWRATAATRAGPGVRGGHGAISSTASRPRCAWIRRSPLRLDEEETRYVLENLAGRRGGRTSPSHVGRRSCLPTSGYFNGFDEVWREFLTPPPRTTIGTSGPAWFPAARRGRPDCHDARRRARVVRVRWSAPRPTTPRWRVGDPCLLWGSSPAISRPAFGARTRRTGVSVLRAGIKRQTRTSSRTWRGTSRPRSRRSIGSSRRRCSTDQKLPPSTRCGGSSSRRRRRTTTTTGPRRRTRRRDRPDRGAPSARVQTIVPADPQAARDYTPATRVGDCAAAGRPRATT